MHFVVAGIAIMFDRANITQQLMDAERISQKGLADWHGTHPPNIRERYLDAVLGIESLHGRFFFYPFDSLAPNEYWEARVSALAAAISVYTPGNCHHMMQHEGLKSNPRFQLRSDLRKRGCAGVSVETAQFVAEPEVRLSDAVAGYVRGELYRGDGSRAILTNVPDWFVNLER